VEIDKSLAKEYLFQIETGGLLKIIEYDGKCWRIRFTLDLCTWYQIDLPAKKDLNQLLPLIPIQIAAKAWSDCVEDFRIREIETLNQYVLFAGTKHGEKRGFVSIYPPGNEPYAQRRFFPLAKVHEAVLEYGLIVHDDVGLLLELSRRENV